MSRAWVLGLLVVGFVGCGSSDDGGGSLLDGQLVYDGPVPPLVSVTFTDPRGDSMTIDALEGWVTVLVNPEDAGLSQVSAAAEALGGQVVDALPAIGLYTVEADPDAVPDVVVGMRDQAFAPQVLPTMLATPIGATILDLEWEPTDLEPAHGECVSAIAARSGASLEKIDATQDSWWDKLVTVGIPPLRRARLMVAAAERAVQRGERQVIVSTIMAAGNECDVSDWQCELVWLLDWSPYIHELTFASQQVRENIVLVQGAGNVGVDITTLLTSLDAGLSGWQRMVVVGGSEFVTAGDREFNYATERMVFAPSKNVTTTTGCNESGTSFATPEVARVLEEVWREHPNLTSTEMVAALENALSPSRLVATDPANGRTDEFRDFLDREACRIADDCPPIDYTVCYWHYLPDPMGSAQSCDYTDPGNCDLQGGPPIRFSGDTGTALIELLRPSVYPRVAMWRRTPTQDLAVFGFEAGAAVSSVEYGDYALSGGIPLTGHPVRSPPLQDYGLYTIDFEADNPFRFAQVRFVLGSGYTTADCDRNLH